MSESANSREAPIQSVPQPEMLGFSPIVGVDVLPKTSLPPDNPLATIAKVTIDNTVQRRIRWQHALQAIAVVALDPDKSNDAILRLNKYTQTERERADGSPELVEVIDFARGVIVNFGQPNVLRRVLQRGARDAMQESIATTGVTPNLSELPEDLQNAVHSALSLAQELYAQGHEGRGYQTASQRQAIATATERSANLIIK